MYTHLTGRLRRLGAVFWSFFKMSPVTFGGGYAMLPVIGKEIVENRGWMDEEEMNDVIAIAGMAPGGVGVNAAALVGYRVEGVLGAAAAVIGITLPTFAILLLLFLGYLRYGEHPKLAAAMEGVRAAVIAIILLAAFKMGKSAIVDKSTVLLAAAALAALVWTPVHPLAVLIGGMAVGASVAIMKEKLGRPVQVKKDNGYKYPDYFIGEGI